MKIVKSDTRLMNELVALIEEGRNHLAYTVNATTTLTYWRVGKRINNDILENKRAHYGKQIVVSVARQLTELNKIKKDWAKPIRRQKKALMNNTVNHKSS